MRERSEDDFKIHLEEVGEFTYAQRTLGDSLKIRAEFIRLLEGIDPDADGELSGFANIFATHKILVTSCPAGWENLALVKESAHPEVIGVVLRLWKQLEETEDSFRQGAAGKN